MNYKYLFNYKDMGTHNFKCYLLPRNSKCECFLTCTVTNDDAVYTFELP